MMSDPHVRLARLTTEHDRLRRAHAELLALGAHLMSERHGIAIPPEILQDVLTKRAHKAQAIAAMACPAAGSA